jgi:hypothetical protein
MSSILQVFPKEIIAEILSHLDIQNVKNFANTSKLSYQISEKVLESKRQNILTKYTKRYKGLLVKRLNKNSVIMCHYAIQGTTVDQLCRDPRTNRFTITQVESNRKVPILYYQINLDLMIKTLISKFEFINKAYPKILAKNPTQ